MANDKNNINELVSDADETAELEAVTFRQERDADPEFAQESDANTCDFADVARTRSTTINALQYDLEQLRAKWLGLEAEIRVREEVSDRLTAELNDAREAIASRDKRLHERDQSIEALEAGIRERDEAQRDLATQHARVERKLESVRQQLDHAEAALHTGPGAPGDGVGPEQLRRTEAYADTLRRKLQDVIRARDDLADERERLELALADAMETSRSRATALEAEAKTRNELESELASIRDQHAEELRMLRFELGEAQDTVAQTEELNTQLASDLIDTRGFKDELERMLCDNDEKAQQHIERLEAELAKSRRSAQDLEQRLGAKSEAINVLLGELARKTDQLEAIGALGDVIQDMDERITERIDEPPKTNDRDRTTRLLVGKIGDQVLRFPLFKKRLTIGRTADNDIQLNAVYISRRHAVVLTEGDATRIIDWGSKNGVYVNARRVTEHFLANGDILRIGNAKFRYEERPKRDA